MKANLKLGRSLKGQVEGHALLFVSQRRRTRWIRDRYGAGAQADPPRLCGFALDEISAGGTNLDVRGAQDTDALLRTERSRIKVEYRDPNAVEERVIARLRVTESNRKSERVLRLARQRRPEVDLAEDARPVHAVVGRIRGVIKGGIDHLYVERPVSLRVDTDVLVD